VWTSTLDAVADQEHRAGSLFHLPGDFPAWRTVYGWFRRWLELGLFDRLLCDVACLRRRAAGRKPEPSLGIVDTQSVKCIPVRGPRGYDAAKKVLGRKRVALVDADGTWLAIAVVPASTQERDTLPALDVGKAEWPSLREAVLDRLHDAGTEVARIGLLRAPFLWTRAHGTRGTAKALPALVRVLRERASARSDDHCVRRPKPKSASASSLRSGSFLRTMVGSCRSELTTRADSASTTRRSRGLRWPRRRSARSSRSRIPRRSG